LFSQILLDGIQGLHAREEVRNISCKDWLVMVFSGYSNLVNTLPSLLNDYFQPAMESARQTGSSNQILELTSEIMALVVCIYTTNEEMRLFTVPEELETFSESLVKSCNHCAKEIKDWVEDMHTNIPISIAESKDQVYELQLTTPASFETMINNLDHFSASLTTT
ncbi:MAG: hypothetical protein R8M45_08230, partial [Ghiorsea sp.]